MLWRQPGEAGDCIKNPGGPLGIEADGVNIHNGDGFGFIAYDESGRIERKVCTDPSLMGLRAPSALRRSGRGCDIAAARTGQELVHDLCYSLLCTVTLEGGNPRREMKITKIETLVVNARMRNWVLVKVETDQPGLYGWGEATLEWKTKSVVGAVEDLSVLLIGQDPRRIEHLWQIMHRQYFWRGGITNMTAMSGIDQALWDIKGKELGKPVCELLGRSGSRQTAAVRSSRRRDARRHVQDRRADAFAERILESVARGFTAVKAMPIPVAELDRERKRAEARGTVCRGDAEGGGG